MFVMRMAMVRCCACDVEAGATVAAGAADDNDEDDGKITDVDDDEGMKEVVMTTMMVNQCIAGV